MNSAESSSAELSSPQERQTIPLCVDLDGTLIHTDLLWESLVKLLKKNPLYLFAAFAWVLRGRANLKAQVASRVSVDAVTLPYNEEFIHFLRGQADAGRALYLVTASDSRAAEVVGARLNLFRAVLGSDGKQNLKGQEKARVLVERFGPQGFDYAGNSVSDLAVWEQSRRAIVVNGASGIRKGAAQCCDVERIFPPREGWVTAALRALRPHQWLKNLIIFVPLITSHRIGELKLLADSLMAFVAFSLCASSAYILNDLWDLEADRTHETKRKRPFAAGALPLSFGLGAIPLLLGAAVAVGAMVSWSFLAVLGVYFGLTLIYSMRLKSVLLADVFCLAGLYTVRLIAGQEATGIICTYWLLAFSIFIFLSLALLKRSAELAALRVANQSKAEGRAYFGSDLEVVTTFGQVAGYISALVLALYVNSEEVRQLYRSPKVLLAICPLLLFWISRVWLISHRGKMHSDPIVFALRDPLSYVVAMLTLLTMWFAATH